MYDEKLLDLIDKKVPLKFKVNPQQSKELQEMLFAHGVFWSGSSKNSPSHLDCLYLFLTEEDCGLGRGVKHVLTYEASDSDWFVCHSNQEYDLTAQCLTADSKYFVLQNQITALENELKELCNKTKELCNKIKERDSWVVEDK